MTVKGQRRGYSHAVFWRKDGGLCEKSLYMLVCNQNMGMFIATGLTGLTVKR